MRYSILFMLAFILLSSCKDSVIIEDDPPVIVTPDESYEVTIKGILTDNGSHQVYLDNSLISESSLFAANNVILGKTGKVIEVNSNDYLPTYKRIYHHRSNTQIVTSIPLNIRPEPLFIDNLQQRIELSDFSQFVIPFDSYIRNSEVWFKDYNGEGLKELHHDNFDVTNGVNVLDFKSVIYIESQSTSQGTPIRYLIDESILGAEYESVALYHYDSQDYSWRKSEQKVVCNAGECEVSLNDVGWYCLARPYETIYGQLNILGNQANTLNEKSFEIHPFSSPFTERIYSDANGTIHRYMPENTPGEIRITGAEQVVEIPSFSANFKEFEIDFDSETFYTLSLDIQNCNFEGFSGEFWLKNQEELRLISSVNGLSSTMLSQLSEGEIEVITTDENFEESAMEVILESEVGSSDIKLLLCDNVEQSARLFSEDQELDSFQECRIRILSKESIIISDLGTGDSPVLASFEGDVRGEYEGLLYAAEFSNLEQNVSICVRKYDVSNNVIAGQVITKDTETSKVVIMNFAGSIE